MNWLNLYINFYLTIFHFLISVSLKSHSIKVNFSLFIITSTNNYLINSILGLNSFKLYFTRNYNFLFINFKNILIN
jgi:hypothetical protein